MHCVLSFKGAGGSHMTKHRCFSNYWAKTFTSDSKALDLEICLEENNNNMMHVVIKIPEHPLLPQTYIHADANTEGY